MSSPTLITVTGGNLNKTGEHGRSLVATATYNEANNIREFIDRTRSTLGPAQDILIIDDNSPDGTSALIRSIIENDRHVFLITRRFKYGLGSAHKMMKIFAIVKGYKFLVTMDADLSHRPEDIALLLEQAADNVFVIGSRYTSGGESDYVGFRKFVSRIGNLLSRALLGIKLKEFTTSFRVFDVDLLKKAPLYQLRSNGYSYFVETINLIDQIGARLIEVPIHFKDRINDVSKIPRSQIVKSMTSLIMLAYNRRLKRQKFEHGEFEYVRCRSCGEYSLLPLWQDGRDIRLEKMTSDNFLCSSVQSETQRPVLFECLCCGLTQIPPATYDTAVGNYYIDTEDMSYLENFHVKLCTFERAYEKLTPFLPHGRLNFLDIGSYYGAFLHVVTSKGHSACGVEPSKSAAKYSQEVLKHQVVNELFTEGEKFAGQGFDVVTSWDVIEHLENPEAFLDEVGRIVDEGKLFVFSTIMIDSLIARILKKRWHWILPMHLTYYRHRDLCDMLKRHGFETLGCFNHTHYASLSYAAKGVTANMNPLLRKVGLVLSQVIPKAIVLPFALGDVRMYVCRKVDRNKTESINRIGSAT